jgi:putative peptidoglycan lipid II flippase
MQINFLRSAFWVSALTILSRLTGYLRDYFVLNLLGVGIASDALALALKVPAFFRRVFSEGAFQAAFVPTFTHIRDQKGSEEALAFASRVLLCLLGMLLLLVAVGEFYFQPLTKLLFPAKPQTQQLFFELGQITFPYIFLISLAAFWSGIAGVYGRFGWITFSCTLGNLFIVAWVLSMRWIKGSQLPMVYAHWFAWAVLLSGILQWLWTLWGCWRLDIWVPFKKPQWDSALKNFFRRFFASFLSVGVMQVNALIGLIISARFLSVGGITYLNYADRLNQLPASLIGVSLSTVLLPVLSHHMASGAWEKAWRSENYTLRLGLILSTLTAVMMYFFALPIVITLFGHLVGKLSFTDLQQMALTLKILSLGLPAYILIKILNTKLFASGFNNAAFYGSIINVISDIIFSFALVNSWQHLGLATAITLAAWTNVIFIIWYLVSRKNWRLLPSTGRFVGRLLQVTGILSGLSFLVAKSLSIFQEAHFVIKLGTLMGGLIFIAILGCFLMLQRRALSWAHFRLLQKHFFQKANKK